MFDSSMFELKSRGAGCCIVSLATRSSVSDRQVETGRRLCGSRPPARAGRGCVWLAVRQVGAQSQARNKELTLYQIGDEDEIKVKPWSCDCE